MDDFSFRMALSAAAGPRPLLQVCICKRCAPVLADKLVTVAKVKIKGGGEILACVLKIWEHSDTLELIFSFFLPEDTAVIMNKHIARAFL